MSGARNKDGDGFLQRWSRRKIGKRGRGEGDPVGAPRPKAPEAVPEEAAGESDAELLARLELPEPEALGGGDDFATYLRAPLSAALRRRTLRHLWLVKPELASLDGLLEYGEDFNALPETGAGLRTAYETARGYLGSEAEPVAQAKRASTEDTENRCAAVEGKGSARAEPSADREEEHSGQDAAPPGESESTQAGNMEAENSASLPRARRMRFDFGGAGSG